MTTLHFTRRRLTQPRGGNCGSLVATLLVMTAWADEAQPRLCAPRQMPQGPQRKARCGALGYNGW
jgi:hypothetical protein